MKKFFFIIMVLSILTCVALGAYCLIYDRFDVLELRILSIAALTGFFSVTCMCCALTIKIKNLRFFSKLGLFINIISYIFFLLLIWELLDILAFLRNDLLNIIYTLVILCVFFTHGTLMFSIKNKRPAVVNSRTIAIMSSVLGTILLLIVLWTGIRELFYLILLGIFGVFYITGTVLTPFFLPVDKIIKEKGTPEALPIVEQPKEEEKAAEIEVKPEPTQEVEAEPKPEVKIEETKQSESAEEPKKTESTPERIEYLFDELFQRVSKK